MSLVQEGALMSYGMYFGNDDAMWGQLAEIAVRILRGARPGDIPFALPHITGFAVNARTARELGIEIPVDIRTLAEIVD